MTTLKREDLEKTFSPLRIYSAIALGLGATAYLFYTQNEGKNFETILSELAQPNFLWIFLAIFVLFIRDLGYIFRIRYLTNKELDWKGSLYVILLWEFSSAVTPSVVGGTAVAVFLLSKEGIKFGKALAYVMLTAILDNAFFLLSAPVVLLASGLDVFPQDKSVLFEIPLSIKTLFFISYSLILIYTSIMSYALFLKPKSFKWILIKVTSFKLLKKWNETATQYGSDIILASQELKNKGINYWAKAILSTIFVWSARYFLLNCLFAAYKEGMDFSLHLDTFSKQIILWITQLISPTPGGSGFTMYFLTKIFAGGTLIVGIGLIWRILTYFTYLILGSIALPRWLKRVFSNTEKHSQKI
ncbi:MAG: flippase-like domain-containing protein [Cytophagales bacterium]|nr:flippase-like domain-containing protein [Cytophagales bacterium]